MFNFTADCIHWAVNRWSLGGGGRRQIDTQAAAGQVTSSLGGGHWNNVGLKDGKNKITSRGRRYVKDSAARWASCQIKETFTVEN